MLSTFEEGDGATVGTNLVRVTCYESQRPGVADAAGGEVPLGRLLIPKKYTHYHTSGLVVEVALRDERAEQHTVRVDG